VTFSVPILAAVFTVSARIRRFVERVFNQPRPCQPGGEHLRRGL